MFEIELGGEPVDWYAARVVDSSRDVWLQWISGMGSTSGNVFHLVWGDRDIPFETFYGAVRPPGGGGWMRIGFDAHFGQSYIANSVRDIRPYQFTSDDERDAAMLLAAEALLVFGGMYDGLRYSDGQYRVQIDRGANAGIYTLNSFGYPGRRESDVVR